MKKLLWRGLLGLLILVVLAVGFAVWFMLQRLPQREGTLPLSGLSAEVTVRYDEWGVPHLQAANEADLYRALGWVHAQDRLFQMEMMRRLARGELAEILGPKLLPTDRLFRSLGLRQRADEQTAALDMSRPAHQALRAYLDGINQYQATRPLPLEFALLGIPRRDFTPADTYAVAGYMAYSFAAAFRTEPILSRIRDQLGPEYLKIFDLDWHPEGAADHGARLTQADWQGLTKLALLSQDAVQQAALPLLEGSNAWVLSGARTASGKPLLAGDPHISFAVPAVWYEAHLKAPGFELYGHFQALSPAALLGHNQRFGWSLTMFQNDDIDLIAEHTDADHPGQVLVKGQWVPLTSREETIAVKGAPAERIVLQRSPHGAIINTVLGPDAGPTPIAMWWTLMDSDNPVLEAFYNLNRADTLAAARSAVKGIHAPGLNVLWANTSGDIAWWAAARLPQRPAGVHPSFLLDGRTADADKPGWLPFERNPQEENPARGWIMSANHQPASAEPVPGYYNPWDRALRLQQQLQATPSGWTVERARALQLDVQTNFGPRTLAPVLAELRAAAANDEERRLIDQLAAWQGDHRTDQIAPTLFWQWLSELTRQAMGDELGDEPGSSGVEALRRTRAIEQALPRLLADPASPWWDRRDTADKQETRATIVAAAWQAALQHLRSLYGNDPASWTWGRAHTITHVHPLGRQAPLDKVFNVGPWPAPGAREVPNNLAQPFGPAPWAVTYGPSTRRVIDFAQPDQAQGSNPVGQSGVWGDPHYRDQAELWLRGDVRTEYLSDADVGAHVKQTLSLRP
ncbi:penicillin acylase family protein [Ideonella sp. 4Y11]|uniref:Penicillin acylase family protein n=1 Tax=Ideonella aquatica TaxID=2824119 RepID=A0A941BJX9_9BURK|nr:penicillin acylase family protein [Ideonella aquatica]MBQ0957974.1 penicillin acylase family protein [Ideonella aquatica]